MTSQQAIVAIEDVLGAQGYTQARDFFDFHHLNESVAHASYRIGPGSAVYDLTSCPGMTRYRRDLEVFIAWRPLASDYAATLRSTMMPAEDALITALRALDIIAGDRLSSAYVEDAGYIVWQLNVGVNYKGN